MSYRRHFEITMDTQNSSVPPHILVVDDDDPAMRRLEFVYRIAHPILHDEIYRIGCEALRNARCAQPSTRMTGETPGALRRRYP
jgi:hypothetical protein